MSVRHNAGWGTRLFLFPVLFCVAAPAYAADYHAGSGCAALPGYVAPPDLEARPGFGANGKEVAPADLNPSPMDIEALKHPDINLRIPLSQYSKTVQNNPTISQAELQTGPLHVGEQGEVTLGDQILSTGAQGVVPAGCSQ